MNKETKNKKYTEVWGDTVVLKELLYSCIIGVFLTMGMFFLGQKIFHSFENIEKSLANGYALLIGVIGCTLLLLLLLTCIIPFIIVQMANKEIEEGKNLQI